MKIQAPPYSSIPTGGASAQGTRRTGSLYAAGRDPLRGVFRSLADPITAGMHRRTNIGFPEAGSARANLADAARLLGTVALPGPSTIRVGMDASDWGTVAGTLITTLTPGRGGLLDLGDATAGAEQTFLTRQVTLTDFCYPDSENPGAVILSLRHSLDINTLAVQSAPVGRDSKLVEVSWYDLSEVASVAVNRLEAGGVRPSLVSLTFLAAARSSEYPDRCAAEALRTHVVSNSGCKRVCERLDRFGRCLVAMLRSRAFPHRLLTVFGGLLSWMAQPEIASVTAVTRGPQEGVKTDMTNAPRSSVNVPACVYLDLDDEIKIGVKDRGFSVIYVVFVYNQKLGREGVRIHLIRSRLPETVFKEGLEHMYSRLRVSNVISGIEGVSVPKPSPNAALPLLRLYADAKAATPGKARKITNAGEDVPFGADKRRAAGDESKYRWDPDTRNRPSPDSCMYAAYCRVGYMDDLSTTQRISKRCGSVDLPTVFLKGVSWNIGQWIECY